MNKNIRLDQVFYGTSPSGYGILGTSLMDKSVAQSAVNACLAVGQNPGSGLGKPILLSRVLGDRIVMARLCNGGKDSSGRNSIFIHALVASAQEVRSANVTTFSLEDDGVFRHRTPDSPSMPIVVEARSRPEAPSSMQLELPAAIEASEPDIALMRRIVSGRENELSWSTFAYDDMPGYDVICLSPLSSSPVGRNIYDADLRLVRRAFGTRKVSVSVPVSTRDEVSSLSQKLSFSPDDPSSKKRGLLMALIVSIGVNIVLLVVLYIHPGFRGVEKQSTTYEKPSTIINSFKQEFPEEKRVTDEELRPLKEFLDKRKNEKEWEERRTVFDKLLLYRLFVEQTNLNQEKEK